MKEPELVRIWDIWVRAFHWSLAISVTFMLISGATGWLFFDWHRTIGEVIMMLIIFRLLWGIVGSGNARLLLLFSHPREAFKHLSALFKRRLHPERGHNAAGSWAVVLMLSMLAVQAGTGFFIADEEELIEGALYGNLSGSVTDLLYRVHQTNAELLQIVVIVHVVMVFAYLVYGRQNLILPMVSGSMKWLSDKVVPTIIFQANWVGALALVISGAIVGFFADWYG